MIDAHAHILPCVDDGAKDLEESLKMAKIAWNDGTKTILCTSHFYEEHHFLKGQALKELYEQFRDSLLKNHIDLKVILGNEAFISPNLPEMVQQKKVFTINESRYLLMELPLGEIPIYTEDIFYELMLKGFVPILAHPERYIKIQEDPNILYKWIERGVLVQVNGGSFRGRFGKEAYDTAYTLLRHKMIHMIGSDAHGYRRRRPMLKETYDLLVKEMGEKQARKIFYEYPQKIIDDQDILIDMPMEVQKKSVVSWIKNIMSKFTFYDKNKHKMVR